MLLLILATLLTSSVSLNCSIQEYTFAYLYNENTTLYEVHGLWPDCCNQVGWPSYCQNVTFNVTELEPIMSQLEQVWFPTNNSTTQIELWSHEYLKHGSCTHWDELNYFEVALCLNSKVNTSSCSEHECSFNFKENTTCNLLYDC